MAEQLRKNRSLAMLVAVALSLVAGLGVVLLEARSVFAGMSTAQLTAVVCMLVLPIIAVVVIRYDRRARQHVAQRRVDLAREHSQDAMAASGPRLQIDGAERLAEVLVRDGSIDPSAASDTLAGVEVVAQSPETRPAGMPQRAHRRRVIHEPAYETPPARAER